MEGWVDNFIHADMHPGNIPVRVAQSKSSRKRLFKSKPHVIFLDLGTTAELSKSDKKNFKAVALRDGCTAAEGTLSLSKQHKYPDPKPFIELGWAGWGQPWNARLRSSGFLWGRRFPFGLAPCESRRSFGLHLISSAHSLVQPSFILCATMRKKVILQPQQSISNLNWHAELLGVKLMTLCIAGLQQNGALTSIRDCLCVNKGLPLPLLMLWDRASVYVQKLRDTMFSLPLFNFKQHRMLTDFEGVARKNEVGFCIWTSKEGIGMLRGSYNLDGYASRRACQMVKLQLMVFFVLQFHQYQVVGRKLPMASNEHPKIYQMKLWATNEVHAKSKYFMRKLKKVKKSNGQVLAINESMYFWGGEVVPSQLSSWQNPILMGRLVKSQAGNAFFAIVPGQVLLASLDAISFDFIGVASVGLLLKIELQLFLCFGLSLSLICK
ncbi:unnamed protein product [Prunus armeniaca]